VSGTLTNGTQTATVVDIADAVSKRHSNSLDHSNSGDHSHSNKSTLDTYSQTNADIADAVSKRHANTLDHSNATDHSHSNKTVLDTYDQTNANIASAVTLKHSNSLDHSNTLDHSHANKSTLDTYDQTNANISDAVSKRHSNTLDHSNSLDHDGATQDSAIAGKTTLSAVKADSEIADAITKKHANTLDHSNSLDHDGSAQNTAIAGKEPANSNIQAHVTAAHAPSNAQKNSDILKSEVEAVLTGAITSHTHASLGMAINVQALTSSPTDAQTIYFGTLPKAPVTTGGQSKIYVRKAGTIKGVEVYCYSGTAGTNEAWSLYVRVNNATDTLIATLSVATNERVFTNAALNISVAAGDYFEIKSVNPTWATNPLTTIFGGYVYME
jgi:hypothetical protein